MKFCILDENHNVIPAINFESWGKFFSDFSNCRVAEDFVGDVRISTVFLGINHRLFQGLFETMSFEKDKEQQERYHTWDEAIAGHEKMVREYEEKLKQKRKEA